MTFFFVSTKFSFVYFIAASLVLGGNCFYAYLVSSDPSSLPVRKISEFASRLQNQS